MTILGLNHFTIMAPMELMMQVRDFYVQVLGLEEGYRPDLGFAGYWLCANGDAVVHLMEGDPGGAVHATGTGHLDHIAFTATDLDGTESRFKKLGLEYKKSEYPDFNLTQLFIHDPVGLGVEMNFAS